MKHKSGWSGYLRNWQLVLFLLPTIACLGVFHYVPLYGLVIAFKQLNPVKGVWGSPWVGLDNFRNLFEVPSFREVLRNTIWISFLRIIFGFPAPIILALLLNEIRARSFKKVVQTVSYLPHFLSWVILSGIFINLLSPTTGAVNAIIKAFGGKPIYFLGNPDSFVPTLIVTGIWQSVGWSSIIYLAAIASVNPELYEAAVVDGANRFRRMIHITLPGIAPVISIMLILTSGNLINAGFDQIFNMYNPAVYRVADIIDTYVYRRGLINQEYSFTTAVGLFKNVISFIMVLSANWAVKRLNRGEGGIW